MYRRSQLFTALITFFLLLHMEAGLTQAPPTPAKPDYNQIRTKEGKVYLKCFIKKVEPDALTIRHSTGMARISFFSLNKEIQNRFNFDPIAAVRKADKEEKSRRDMKWKLFWEKQQYETALAQQEEKEKLYHTAKRDWLPIKATILKRHNGGAYITGSRIVFVATKTKSTLGFPRSGPPKIKLIPLTPHVLFIQNPFGKISTSEGSVWKGYIEAFPSSKAPPLSSGGHSIQVRRALPKEK